MGGLAKALPWTTRMMWVGTIALIGIWPVSKDEILAAAIHNGDTTALIVYVGGLIGAFFTGIYAVRLMRLVFYGERSEFAKEHLHTDHGEAPWEMMFAGRGAGGRHAARRLPVDRVRRQGHLRRLARRDRADDPADHRAGPADHGDRLGGRHRRRRVARGGCTTRPSESPRCAGGSRCRRSSPSASSAGTSSTTTSATAAAVCAGDLLRQLRPLGDRRLGLAGRADGAAARLRDGGGADRASSASTHAVLTLGAAVTGRLLPRKGQPVTVALIFLPLAAAVAGRHAAARTPGDRGHRAAGGDGRAGAGGSSR